MSLADSGVHGNPEVPGRGETPGVEDVAGEFVVRDLIEFDSDPSADAYVGGLEECGRRVVDEGLLGAGSGRNPHGDVPVVMVVIGEHGEDLVAYEESGLSVGEFLGGCGESGADFADAAQVFFVVVLLMD